MYIIGIQKKCELRYQRGSKCLPRASPVFVKIYAQSQFTRLNTCCTMKHLSLYVLYASVLFVKYVTLPESLICFEVL